MTAVNADSKTTGAFVVSLDFELLWGVRDRQSAVQSYRENLLGARRAIPEMLALMEEHEIAATWATVGFLFAQTRDEVKRYLPAIRPQYERRELNPYGDWGDGNREDNLLRYAPELIDRILETPKQEVGCHTFSHYYCLEPGQSRKAFEADLESAMTLAAKRGLRLRSLVLPRNQINHSYQEVLPKLGFTSYRGIEQGWMYNSSPKRRNAPLRRMGRLADQYGLHSGRHPTSWEEIPVGPALANVRGSLFLRPYSDYLRAVEGLRLARIRTAIRSAAMTGRIFHLWWHPHNFGRNIKENIGFLRSIFETVCECRERWGLQSLSMQQIAEQVPFPSAKAATVGVL